MPFKYSPPPPPLAAPLRKKKKPTQLLSRKKCWLPSCADGNIFVCFACWLDPPGVAGVPGGMRGAPA